MYGKEDEELRIPYTYTNPIVGALICPAHTLPDPCHIAWYVTARAIVGRANGHLHPTGRMSGQVSNKNKTKKRKKKKEKQDKT